MISFAPITLETKELFSKYASPQIRNCDASFANIFCWQQTYHSEFAETDGFLVVKYRIEGSCNAAYMLFTPQFTHDGLRRLIPRLEQDAQNQRQPLRISGLPECAVGMLRELFGERFACAANRDTDDYIYSAVDLRELQGRRYQPKRNHLNRFNDFYDWKYEPLDSRHKEECLRLENQWQSHHHNDQTISAERLAILRAFDNFEALGLAGGLLRIDGRIAAFTYGSPINYEVFDIHVEKADTSYEGIFPAINRLFASSIPDSYKFINREEDMGLDGLRRSKMSYHPIALEQKFTALSLTPVEQQMRQLWEEAFGDSRDFADKFLVERQSYNIHTLTTHIDGRLAAMLHIVPFTDAAGHRIAYLYGVATGAEYRRRGLATSLMQNAIHLARQQFDAMMLIPADEQVQDFYRRFGFEESGLAVSFNCEFGFGNGEEESDRAMILKFSNIELTSMSDLTLQPMMVGIEEPEIEMQSV